MPVRPRPTPEGTGHYERSRARDGDASGIPRSHLQNHRNVEVDQEASRCFWVGALSDDDVCWRDVLVKNAAVFEQGSMYLDCVLQHLEKLKYGLL